MTTTTTEALADLATCANLDGKHRAAAIYALAGALAHLAETEPETPEDVAALVDRLDAIGLDCFRVSYYVARA